METETERVAVKTYVPAYQKAEWQAHADQLEMSQSEFVRSMVQAGRRGFLDTDETEKTDTEPPDAGRKDQRALQDRVQDVLTTSDHRSWDDLLEALTDDIESRLEETLAELQAENVIRYSGRNGGYTLVER